MYLVLVLKSSLSCFKLYYNILAAKRGCTATTTELGLLMTEKPLESLMTTFENTVYVLVAGGLIIIVKLNENVPTDWLSVLILNEISVEVIN